MEDTTVIYLTDFGRWYLSVLYLLMSEYCCAKCYCLLKLPSRFRCVNGDRGHYQTGKTNNVEKVLILIERRDGVCEGGFGDERC